MPKRRKGPGGTLPDYASAHVNCHEGRFIQLGDSLLLCEPFRKLKPTTKLMYQAMMMEAAGKKSGFEFSHGDAKRYNISSSAYDRGKQELISRGFIKQIAPEGTPQYATNKFAFVNDWKLKLANNRMANNVIK